MVLPGGLGRGLLGPGPRAPALTLQSSVLGPSFPTSLVSPGYCRASSRSLSPHPRGSSPSLGSSVGTGRVDFPFPDLHIAGVPGPPRDPVKRLPASRPSSQTCNYAKLLV